MKTGNVLLLGGGALAAWYFLYYKPQQAAAAAVPLASVPRGSTVTALLPSSTTTVPVATSSAPASQPVPATATAIQQIIANCPNCGSKYVALVNSLSAPQVAGFWNWIFNVYNPSGGAVKTSADPTTQGVISTFQSLGWYN